MPEFIAKELKQFVEVGDWDSLKKRLDNIPPPDIVDVLLLSDTKSRVFAFRTLPRSISAEVFSLLDPEYQDLLLSDLTDGETQTLLSDLPIDDSINLLEELPGPVTRRLFGLLDNEGLRGVRQLLGYPPESVGRLMTLEYVSIDPKWTVQESLDYIRRIGKDSETINIVYVVNDDGVLLDDIRLRVLILSDPNTIVKDLLDKSYASLSAFEDRENAVAMMKKYDLVALPVVDSEDVLIGIVTFDDVMDVAEEEATEDMQKSASVVPLKMSYHRAGIGNLFLKRFWWLAALVLMNLASAGVLDIFKDELSKAIILVAFIPLLIGGGGNAGAQAATLVIRALITDDISMGDWVKTFCKELVVGTLLGAALGFIGGGLGYLWGSSFDISVSLVIGLSMFSIVFLANLVGMSLPFILNKVKIDPAVASGPLITTIVDAAGLYIYILIASAILHL